MQTKLTREILDTRDLPVGDDFVRVLPVGDIAGSTLRIAKMRQ